MYHQDFITPPLENVPNQNSNITTSLVVQTTRAHHEHTHRDKNADSTRLSFNFIKKPMIIHRKINTLRITCDKHLVHSASNPKTEKPVGTAPCILLKGGTETSALSQPNRSVVVVFGRRERGPEIYTKRYMIVRGCRHYIPYTVPGKMIVLERKTGVKHFKSAPRTAIDCCCS